MNEIQIFNSPEFGEIRTVVIDNEPWFVGKDVAMALGYSNTKDALRRHIELEDKRGSQITTPYGEQLMTIINESGLYALIFGSKLESAKKFKRWVTSEVLPSIRRTGGYQMPVLTIPEQIQLLAQGNVELNKRMDTMESELESIKLDLPILPIEADKITAAVKKKGVFIMGGKESCAYNNKGLRRKVYNNLYANLKYNFGVKSYKSIKRSDCEKAVEIVNSYQPPFFLQQEIESENAQQKFAM